MSSPYFKSAYQDPDAPPPGHDLTGQKFGLLTARRCYGKCAGSYAWLCYCDCGGTKVTKANLLQKGKVKSCGCLNGQYA